MKLSVSESNDKFIRFTLSGATPRYANAIRRAAMNFVKVFAIDSVTFYENTSAMFDEYIAHRIGLVPITTPTGKLNEDEQVLFTADATGPKTVYSRELESGDSDVKVANDNIPIIKLAEGQRLRIDCKAVLSNGSRHAKFQPCLVSYEQKGDDTFEFYVETFGQMPPKDIVSKALDAVAAELKEAKNETKKI